MKIQIMTLGIIVGLFIGLSSVAYSQKKEIPENYYINLIQEIDPYTSLQSGKDMRQFFSRKDVQPLINLLDERPIHAGIRSQIIVLLGQLKDPMASEKLISIMNNTNETVFNRTKAAEALGIIQEEEAVDSLIELTKNSNDELRISSMLALGQIGNTKAIPAIIERLNYDRVEKVRWMACSALGTIGHADACTDIEFLLNNRFESSSLREAATDALRKINRPESLKVLVPNITDPNSNIAIACILAVGTIIGNNTKVDKGNLASKALLECYNNPSLGTVSNIAAVALVRIHGDEKFMPLVQQGLENVNPSVRLKTIQAVYDLHIKGVDRMIRERLKDSEPDVAYYAAKFLIEEGNSFEDLKIDGYTGPQP